MLAVLGHGTECVNTAEEAIDLLKTRHYHVLLADINLPGMSGIALAEIAVRIVQGIKIIFASGYGYLVADKTDFDFTLLPKPYGLSQLRHAIEQVVSSGAAPA